MIFMTAILSLLFMRPEVCEAEKPYNHPVEISLPDTVSVAELVQFLMDYKEPNYQAIPPAGGMWWQISYNGGTLALVCKDPLHINYANIPSDAQIKDIGITAVTAVPAQMPR